MDLTNLQTIKNLCRQYGIRPSRKDGQNFLIDKNVLQKLIDSADLKPSDTVLEVGAGFGTITQELVSRVHRVIAVESDKKITGALKENLRNYARNYERNYVGKYPGKCPGTYPDPEIIHADILKVNISSIQALKQSSFKIVANLPYSITSRFLRNFLSSPVKPGDMTLIIQREVADKICAKPKNGMSLLSVSVQFYGEPKIIDYIKPESFWPSPEVESAIIKIRVRKGEEGLGRVRKGVDEEKFFQLARIGFSSRRKMLKNNLSAGLKIGEGEIIQTLNTAGLDAKVRAQDLGVADWIKLAKNSPNF